MDTNDVYSAKPVLPSLEDYKRIEHENLKLKTRIEKLEKFIKDKGFTLPD